jgi:hypothetical protein
LLDIEMWICFYDVLNTGSGVPYGIMVPQRVTTSGNLAVISTSPLSNLSNFDIKCVKNYIQARLLATANSLPIPDIRCPLGCGRTPPHRDAGRHASGNLGSKNERRAIHCLPNCRFATFTGGEEGKRREEATHLAHGCLATGQIIHAHSKY